MAGTLQGRVAQSRRRTCPQGTTDTLPNSFGQLLTSTSPAGNRHSAKRLLPSRNDLQGTRRMTLAPSDCQIDL